MNRIQHHLGGPAPENSPPTTAAVSTSWDLGPPQNPAENWRYQRRAELLNMATMFTAREVTQAIGGQDDPQEVARRAVEQAVALQQALDAARPRS